jgi:integrating conjugative element protein (TIGR03757 family)
MRQSLFSRVALLMCLSIAVAPVFGTEVWVITDQHHRVKSPPHVRLIELDAPGRIEVELAAQLPSDPTKAAIIAERRVREGGEPLHRQLAAAYQGIVDAWSLGITKIPAVVVDRRFVVYGEPNVDVAIKLIAQYRSNQP